MHMNEIHRLQHAHTFGTDAYRPGERRTRWVIALTSSMMVVEIVAGMAFGSMALLADGEVSPHEGPVTVRRPGVWFTT